MKIAFVGEIGIISQLMPTQLPERIDVIRWIEKRHRISGEYPLVKFQRLRPLLSDESGSVAFELEFGKKGSVAAVTGHLTASLRCTCQLCLGTLVLPVDAEIRLGVVSTLGEADRLPEGFEPLLTESGWIALADVVEDELLLAVPIVPQHEHCSVVDTELHHDTDTSKN